MSTTVAPDSRASHRTPRPAANTIVWFTIAVTSVLRCVVIARSFYWQDDYVHIWTTWNASPADMILQEWNGHREPLAFGAQWFIAHFWPQEWAPAAIVLCMLAVALPVCFWVALRRIVGVNQASVAATVLFCLWPGLLIPQTWLSAGLEAFSLVTILIAVSLYAGSQGHRISIILTLLVVGYLFNERALFMLPVLLAVGYLFAAGSVNDRVRSLITKDRWLWLCLGLLTVVLMVGGRLLPRAPNGGRPAGVSDTLQGFWYAGPAGAARDVIGWNILWPPDRSTMPSSTPLWLMLVTAVVWAGIIYVGWDLDRHQLLHVAGVVAVFLVVETAVVAWFRGGFIGPVVHQDPRYYLVTGTVLLMGIGSFGTAPTPGLRLPTQLVLRLIAVTSVMAALVSGVAIARTTNGSSAQQWLTTARSSFVLPDGPALVPTPSPAGMLSDIFVGRDERGVPFELATTRTLLAVGERQPTIMASTLLPVGADRRGQLAPVTVEPVKSVTPVNFGADCKVEAAGEWLPVPMEPAGLGNPLLAIDYLATTPVSVAVRAGAWQQSAALEPGLKTLWLIPPYGDFSGFEIRVIEGSGTVCIGGSRAGGAAVTDVVTNP